MAQAQLKSSIPQARQYEQSTDNEAQANKLAAQSFEYAKNVAGMYRKEDKELWDLMVNVPRLSGPWPYICFILNIILPGTGTMISSCVGYQGAWSKTQLTIGFVQMLTAVYIVGWIFSVWWGWLILQKGIKDKAEVQQFLNRTNARSEGAPPASV